MERILFHIIIYTRSCACYNIETIMKDHIIAFFLKKKKKKKKRQYNFI